MQDYLRLVCITANVESFAEDPSLVKPWVAAVAAEIAEQKPNFAVIHIQGLPAAQESRSRDEPVFSPGHLYTKLVDDPQIASHFRTSRGFFDTEASSNEFTGLGSIYLVQDPKTAEMWNVTNNSYAPIQQGHEFLDKVSRNPNVLRVPFPDKLNPNARGGGGLGGFFGGKKSTDEPPSPPVGFLTTKWNIFGRTFGFTNLQLHSNSSVGFRDLRQSSHDGALIRQDQIQFMLQRLESQNEDEAHYFAGAFNSELDQDSLIKDLAKHMSGACTDKIGENGTVKNVEYFDFKGQPLITLGERRFDFHTSHNWYFGFSRGQMVKKYNREISKETFAGVLNEPPIYFAPSSHYSYDKREDKDSFLRHRCPQWSDRIFANEQAWDMMKYDSFSGSGLYYGIIGTNEYLGEHKPIALHATICVKPSHKLGGPGSPKMTSV